MKFFIFLISLIFSVESISAMCWGIENKSGEKFNILFTNDDTIDVVISCDEKSQQSLERKFRKLFKKNGTEFFYSRLGRDYPKAEEHDERASYFPEDQKLICKGTPMSISIAKLAEIIKTQKVIFYTGAGISAGAVPTMNELMNDLGLSQNLKEERDLQKYVGEIIRNPDHYVKILQKFYDKCKNAAPTVAHAVLARIVRSYHHLLITENLDQLHQKTELDPIVFAGYDKYSEALKGNVENTNFVITIGLNTDESGFLKWYRTNNPRGKIISINLVDTCYLSDGDFSIKGDAQVIMQQLGGMI
jgi:NAD-dependent SIR2 family protein deacetylase